MFAQSVFIFRRDLRLRDNTGLIAAMEASTQVMPVFIVDPGLFGLWRDAVARMTFLAQALRHLDSEIAKSGGRLRVLYGEPAVVLGQLLAAHAIGAVYVNRDFTPLSQRRDSKIRALCQRRGVQFHSYADQLMNEPESIAKLDGTPYSVFTPYFRKAREQLIALPASKVGFDFADAEPGSLLSDSVFEKYLYQKVASNLMSPRVALARLKKLDHYDESKDQPAEAGTSRLSAHLRFGTVSVREVYQSISQHHSSSHGLIRQLYWRDFYFHIGFHFPHVFTSAFRAKYNHLSWDDNEAGYRLWQEGKTGFPIIDAGMRELLATGFMHNRVRMIVASFLTKNLLIDWRRGEAHFAKHLVDFDPAINNGNWQWGASTGCDAQPYFRIFNPWRQQLRFDKECRYIKQWVPELKDMDARQIHRLEKVGDGYLPVIADLRASGEESKRRFSFLNAGQNTEHLL